MQQQDELWGAEGGPVERGRSVQPENEFEEEEEVVNDGPSLATCPTCHQPLEEDKGAGSLEDELVCDGGCCLRFMAQEARWSCAVCDYDICGPCAGFGRQRGRAGKRVAVSGGGDAGRRK